MTQSETGSTDLNKLIRWYQVNNSSLNVAITNLMNSKQGENNLLVSITGTNIGRILRISVSQLRSTHIYKTVSLNKLLFFPSNCTFSSFLPCPTHITFVFSKRTLSMCLRNILPCYLLFLASISSSPSATTARRSAYISFLSMSFVPMFLLIT